MGLTGERLHILNAEFTLSTQSGHRLERSVLVLPKEPTPLLGSEMKQNKPIRVGLKYFENDLGCCNAANSGS